MKVAVLYSGGKDSSLALLKALEEDKVECLITIISENAESYMLQTANINFTKIQAEAMQIPIIIEKTKGIKEEELKDISNAIKKAKEEYNIEGVYTGAIASNYQKERIEKICTELNLKCFNPLWERDQEEILKDAVKNFKIIITGTAVEELLPYLGKEITTELSEEIIQLSKKYRFNPAGEGGEIETTITNAPYFKKQIKILEIIKHQNQNSGTCEIKAELN